MSSWLGPDAGRPRCAEAGMVSVIVVLENPGSPDLVMVHAAPSAPDVPGDPGPLTACGIDTTEMVTYPWQPSRPGQRRWQPELRDRVRPRCDQAVRVA
ncbi:hypothetical protein GCM10010430_50990 [Kitasatospora cystarginea]|uniref:Uncharacterized protein n=1 Tax=Kitasatospora cystarginea TaxID=58350 RepID=A0ABP5RFL3_9ACTN